MVIVPVAGESGDRARIVGKKGDPSVELHGKVGELVLFLSGRQRVSHVEVIGSDVAALAIQTAKLGL